MNLEPALEYGELNSGVLPTTLLCRRRCKGASLIQMLCVTAMFALLSAVAFPKIATPTRVARMAAAGHGTESAMLRIWTRFKANSRLRPSEVSR